MIIVRAQTVMRAATSVLLLATSCASPSSPPTPAIEVEAGPAVTSSPSILERAQGGLLFVDGGPQGAVDVAADPHAGHHGHHMHHGHMPAAVVDAGPTP